MNIPGVKEVTITDVVKLNICKNHLDALNLIYEEKELSIKGIINEVKLYTKLAAEHSIIVFNKHDKTSTEKLFKRYGICCEYCHNDLAEDLILCDGITYFSTNYFKSKKENEKLVFKIKYNNTIKPETNNRIMSVLEKIYK